MCDCYVHCDHHRSTALLQIKIREQRLYAQLALSSRTKGFNCDNQAYFTRQSFYPAFPSNLKKKTLQNFPSSIGHIFFFSFPFSAFSNSLLNIHKFRMQKLHAGKKVGKIVLLYTRNHVSSSALNVRVRESVYLVRHQTDFESCYHPSE